MRVNDAELQLDFAANVMQLIQNLKVNHSIVPPMYKSVVHFDAGNRMSGTYLEQKNRCIFDFGRYSADGNIIFVYNGLINTIFYKRNTKLLEIRNLDEVGTGKKYHRYSDEEFIMLPDVPKDADDEFWFQYSTVQKHSDIVRMYIEFERLNTGKYKVPGFRCSNLKPIKSILEYQKYNT